MKSISLCNTRSIKEWNDWREKNPDIIPDLSEANSTAPGGVGNV